MKTFAIPPHIVTELEKLKLGAKAKLQSLSDKNRGPRSAIVIPASQLTQLVADGWLPNHPPFAPAPPLTAEELAILHGPGPGTELAKIIEENFGTKSFPGCGCNSRIIEMNKWGVCGCRANIDTIVGWVKTAFGKMFPGQPFVPEAGKIVINQAIDAADRGDACCPGRDGSMVI
jgi:hypothetical protein